MTDTVKLTKKQKKALEFRQKKENKEIPDEKDKKRKRDDEEPIKDKEQVASVDGEEPPKKRKTRRGKKGKGINGGKGPRFILFAGNLPYDVTEAELQTHFHACKPDRIRLRTDKGIAFLEFDNDTQEIQKKMEVALRMHHSLLRKRKINVELTVGGGGNSENRVQKIKDKNSKLLDERRDRITKETEQKSEKKQKAEQKTQTLTGVHPARAALMN